MCIDSNIYIYICIYNSRHTSVYTSRSTHTHTHTYIYIYIPTLVAPVSKLVREAERLPDPQKAIFRGSRPTRAWSLQSQTGELLWRDTGGIHWRMLASRSGYSAGSTGKGYSAGYSAGSTGGLLWWDTWRDPLTGGMLGGIHWRAALGYSAGGLLWWDTRRDPVTGGILGGIAWRATLAGPPLAS